MNHDIKKKGSYDVFASVNIIQDQYEITDKDDYPDDNHCHWYELTSVKDEKNILNAWNDEDHMIIDDKFEVVE